MPGLTLGLVVLERLLGSRMLPGGCEGDGDLELGVDKTVAVGDDVVVREEFAKFVAELPVDHDGFVKELSNSLVVEKNIDVFEF